MADDASWVRLRVAVLADRADSDTDTYHKKAKWPDVCAGHLAFMLMLDYISGTYSGPYRRSIATAGMCP